MSTRRRAREVVMQLLYRDELNEPASEASDRHFLLGRLLGNKGLVAFALAILVGVRQRRDHLDRMLADATENWRLNRMANTDRNILRMAAWEIRYGETPHRVVINEAIELARRYGDRNSPRFVNGVLDRLMHTPHDRQTLDALLESSEPGGTIRGIQPE